MWHGAVWDDSRAPQRRRTKYAAARSTDWRPKCALLHNPPNNTKKDPDISRGLQEASHFLHPAYACQN